MCIFRQAVRLLPAVAVLFASATLSPQSQLTAVAVQKNEAVRAVTFAKDIAPIVFEHCTPCHRPGEAAPFVLMAYEDVRQRAKQIALVTKSRYMPPWKPEPGYGEFAGARRLSDQQVALIQQWVQEGTVEGASTDLPPAPRWVSGWQLGLPDLVVTMPEPYLLRGDGPDVFRSFVIPVPVSARRYVRDLEFRPGNRRAVHHANIKIDQTRSSRGLDEEEPGPGYDGGGGRDAKFPDGHFLGWTPGQLRRVLPEDMAWHLEPGSDLVVELHMMPTGKPEPVQISVGFFFTDRPPLRVPYMLRLGRQDLDIPAGAKDYLSVDTYVLPVDVEVLAVQPHAHSLAKEVSGFARLPDGTTKWLIYIKEWDFNWQDVYYYPDPVALPGGTTLVMQHAYDNSAENVRNPNHPPRRVTFGQTTSSEMGDLWLQVVARHGDDRAVLDRDYAPKMLREDIAGSEKMLEISPGDARVHTDLAFSYLEAGRVVDAIGHFEQAVRLEPRSPEAHYHLGTALLNQRRFDEAGERFSRAVQLKPDFPEAHNNLGVVRYAQGMLDEAIRSYRDAIRIEPDNAEALYNLGRAFASQGKFEEAIRQYREVLAIRPDDAEAHTSLASLLATDRQIEEAIAHYRRALQLKPDLPAALADLAWILAASDRADIRAPDEAVRLAERVAELTRYQDATVLDTLALAYASAGRFDRAVKAAQAALDLASATGPENLGKEIRQRLEFYKRQVR